jgi:hypothetical protein
MSQTQLNISQWATKNPALLIILFVLAVIALSWLLIITLPEMGIGQFSSFFSPFLLLSLIVLVVGGFWYVRYLAISIKRPWLAFLSFVFASDLFTCALRTMQGVTGISLRISALFMLVFTLPLLIVAVKHIKTLPWWRYPMFPAMTVFAGIVSLYYLFFNAHAINYNSVIANDYSVMDWDRLLIVINIPMVMFICLTIMGLLKKDDKFVPLFGKAMVISSLALSIPSIILYPFNIGTMLIGTQRMALIFDHPGTFATTMGYLAFMCVIYGFYFLKRGEPSKLYFITTPIVLTACSLGGTKASLFTTILGIGLIALFELIFNKHKIKKINPKLLIQSTVGFVIALALMASLNVFSSMQSRLEDNSSMTWREIQWDRLYSNNQPDAYLLGNGHTAALKTAQRYCYNTYNMQANETESIYIHNIYIEMFYDYGIFSFIWIVTILYMMIKALHYCWVSPASAQKSFAIGYIAFSIAYLLNLRTSELFFTSNPFSYWVLAPFLYYFGFYLDKPLAPNALATTPSKPA